MMDIEFKSRKLKKRCEDKDRLCRKYGSKQAEQVVMRINEIASSESLYDISKLPQARLHALTNNLNGYFAVDLKHPYRLILYPLNGELPDLKTVTYIKIIDIVDYH